MGFRPRLKGNPLRMAEKSGIAQFLDRLAEGMSKAKESSSESSQEVANILPKPDSQEIKDGLICWKWKTETTTVESFYATSSVNRLEMPKGEYLIDLKISGKISNGKNIYQLTSEIAKEIGQAILSAHNWQHIWKIHAGEFLVGDANEPENFESEPVFSDSDSTKDDA